MNVNQLIELLKNCPGEKPVFACNGDVEEKKPVLDVVTLQYESGNTYVLLNTCPNYLEHLMECVCDE